MRTDKPAKIIMVCASSSTFIGHHFALAREAARSMEVHAVLNMDKPGDAEVIRRGGIVAHPMPLSRKSLNPFRIGMEALRLRAVIRRLNPDMINPINLKSVLVAAMARVGTRCGFVGTITGLGYLFTGDSLKQRVLRRLTARGLASSLPGKRHMLVYSNADDRRELLSLGVSDESSSRIVRVPGVDLSEFGYGAEPEKGYRVVLPARMLWDKGVGDFVEAAALVRKAIPDAEFILAGDTDPNNPSAVDKRRLESWHRDGVVAWAGHCADMPGLLGSCHVACLPSAYREGFPRVLAEAMSCGRAIVTTDMPGCRDAVRLSAAGLLVPPRDPAALADALLYLHAHREERRQMGLQGRRWVERELSVDTITSGMLEIYRIVMEQSGRVSQSVV